MMKLCWVGWGSGASVPTGLAGVRPVTGSAMVPPVHVPVRIGPAP